MKALFTLGCLIQDHKPKLKLDAAYEWKSADSRRFSSFQFHLPPSLHMLPPKMW